jgi:hypothetical protein
MNTNLKSLNSNKKTVYLSFIAGSLILCNSALVGASAKWLPGLLPILPGSSGNDPTLLYTLAAIGLTSGVLVFFGTTMLYLKPAKSRIWGCLIAVFSIPSVICGGGFIVGVVMAVLGGKTAFSPKIRGANSKFTFRFEHG